ncbi:GlxA family transcriptional regulator [Hansschlegelia sp. KR7-227]|uniref:GlxA family transcriptional regulator n=1 Tax=Hansschlegelia sp. KR7-227 TaxID=3400914 RepID=UPI003C0538B3
MDAKTVPSRAQPARPTTIGFLLVERFSMIAFASAIEPLRLANRGAGRALYDLSIWSRSGGACAASNGVEVSVGGRFADAPDLDMALVCGGIDVEKADHAALIALLRRLASRRRALGALCTGPHVLARAGLLDGYRATIHWENIPSLTTEHPDTDVDSELFEIDRDRLTCGGGFAAADMMLAVIARDHGAALASEVAEQLLHPRIREAGERQRMDLRMRLGVAHPKLLKVVALMEETIEEPLSSQDLAAAVGLSTRQLERLFFKYLGQSPAKRYLRIRLERARALIRQTSMPILSIALECGFSSASHFSRAYLEGFGKPPSAERKSPAAVLHERR